MQEDEKGYCDSGETGAWRDPALAPLFAALDLTTTMLEAAAARAARHGHTLEDELILGGMVPEDALYRAMAAHCGLRFAAALPAELVSEAETLDSQLVTPMLVRLKGGRERPHLAMAPRLKDIRRHQAAFRESITRQRSHLVTTPSAIRRAVWDAGAKRRVRAVVTALEHDQPLDSASRTLVSWQAYILGVLSSALAIFAFLAPLLVAQTILACLTLVYAVTIALRLASLPQVWRPAAPCPPGTEEEALPVYTVLVALYREDGMIDQLLGALAALDWPPSRLDIKLVCEADDHETLTALGLRPLPPHVEIVHVPPFPPRTKPKALNYALKGARGDFVTVYDAEDRPEPGQLREAWLRFSREDDGLACLQAPLVIDGNPASWIADLFAADYFAQFRGYLPMLEQHGWPIPLGGTSNHFRRSALVAAGGWDPHNVTEDADLGLRLARQGYRIGLIETPTFENAPGTRAVWIRQRSRWMKGWLQTCLVNLRRPRPFVRALGWAGALIAIVTGAGAVLSALLYPAFFASLGLVAVLAGRGVLPPPCSFSGLLMITSGITMLAGYVYSLLSVIAWHRYEGRPLRLRLLLRIPHLWLLLTIAAWRAIAQLVTAPHLWDKTPHAPARTKPPEHGKPSDAA